MVQWTTSWQKMFEWQLTRDQVQWMVVYLLKSLSPSGGVFASLSLSTDNNADCWGLLMKEGSGWSFSCAVWNCREQESSAVENWTSVLLLLQVRYLGLSLFPTANYSIDPRFLPSAWATTVIELFLLLLTPGKSSFALVFCWSNMSWLPRMKA